MQKYNMAITAATTSAPRQSLLPKLKHTTVFFDSRARDLTLYPNPNRFKITLASPIRNVRNIYLANLLIPNANSATNWIFAVTIDKFGTDLMRTYGVPGFPNGVVGVFRAFDPTNPWVLYRASDDEHSSKIEFTGGIPRLQDFELSIVTVDEVGGVSITLPTGAVFWNPADPDPDMTRSYKNCYGTLVIEHDF